MSNNRLIIVLATVLGVVLLVLVVVVVWKNVNNRATIWFFKDFKEVPVVLVIPLSVLFGCILVYPLMALQLIRARRRLRKCEDTKDTEQT